MPKPTIFESYRAVENYFQALERIHGELPLIPVDIQPIDVFVLQQIAAFYAVPPIIVDLAALPTSGVSLALWGNASSEVRAVLPAYLSSQLQQEDMNEYHRIIARIRETVDYLLLEAPSLPLDDAIGWQETAGVFQQNAPIIVMIACSHDSHTDILSELNILARLMPSAVFAILPMGRINAPAAFAAAEFCAGNRDWNLFLMSEVTFTLFSSEIGIIYPKDDEYLLPAVERIKQHFTSNFDFLSLLEMNFSLQQAYQKLEKEFQLEVEKRLEMQLAINNLLAAREQEHALYHGLIGYIRGLYRAVVPLPLRLLLRNLRVGIINILRRIYHLLIPLRVRLKLRDIRVALIGR
jgi:hypothetical protein